MNNFLQLQTRTKKLACLWAGLLWITLLPIQAQEQDDMLVLNNLKQMSLRDLGQVEIRLDETFDVFDGLIQAKKTTVATGIKQYTDRAPSVTTVITAQDIEAMGARTLEEALRSVPGLQVSYNQINIPVYTFRGISSIDNPEVLMLINGIRANDSYKGSKGEYWNGFPVSAISRVETIRGPGSAVYGADAFSGVINIVTKTAQETKGTEAGFRFGKFNTQDAWLVHGGQWYGLDIVATVELNHTDGHQRMVESDAQTVWDKVFGTHASLAPGPYSSEITTYDARVDIAKQHWQFRAGFHRGDDTGTGVGVGQALDPTKPWDVKRINADLTYHRPQFTDNWDVQAQLSYLHTGSELAFQIFPPGAFGGAYPIGYIGEPSAFQNDTQLALSGLYRGLDDHLIRIGVGYAHYDLYKIGEVKNFGTNPFTGGQISPITPIDVSDTPEIYSPEVSRNNEYVFLQDTWTMSPNWELTTGLRYDNYSDFGSTMNPRLGLVWEPHSELTTKLLYGRAFRAPAFSELYNQNNPVSIGNPNLKPEKIETWEVALDYRAKSNLHLALNLFYYDIKDKIALVPVTGSSDLGYANNIKWKGQGGEFELRWKTSTKSSLLFNYSYQNSKNKTTNVTLNNAPQQFAFVRGDHLIGSYWYLDGQVNWLNEWPRDVNDPRPAMDGYTTVDLTLRRKDVRGGKINFALGIKNLFDADVRYPSPGPGVGSVVVNVPNDLPGSGRFFFGELRYQF